MRNGFQFDQVYIISDLHFGGRPGFQIFGSQTEMQWFLKQLTALPARQRVALVINGDFIDFLAEEPARHFDPDGAIAKLERITFDDTTFGPIFADLRAFLATPDRHLIINLGNHDLELALPWVGARLEQILTQKSDVNNISQEYDADAKSRLHMIFDGSGVRAQIGNKSVLCVHGNEVDRWNPADFETLRKIGRDVQFGRAVEPWIPNAGSKMVIEVMNSIKKTYPFVDLLKPEFGAVVPTLLACDPSQVSKLDDVLGVVASRLKAAFFKPDGMLGAENPPESSKPSQSNAGRTAAFMASQFPVKRERQSENADIFMQSAEIETRKGTRPLDLLQQDVGQQLGVCSAIGDFFTGKSSSEVLREALEKRDKDCSFKLDDKDDTFKDLDKQIGKDIDYLVAGHTHLERAIPRTGGNGYYYNSGTWARLIRMQAATRQNPEQFRDWFDTLKNSNMAALDAKDGLIQKFCSVVVIQNTADGVIGELRHIETKTDKDKPGGAAVTDYQPIAASRFPRN